MMKPTQLCDEPQNSRFWKTKEKHPIFCKDTSWSWLGETGCVECICAGAKQGHKKR